MAFAAADVSSSTSDSRAMSIGPLKAQLLTWSAASGDTSGTVTADKLYSAQHIIIDGGLIQNAAATFSGNTNPNISTIALVASSF